MNHITTLREADEIAKNTAISVQHTQGPIRYDYAPGYCGELIASDGHSVATFDDEPSQEDARRLAACWNVCQGATTEQLERSKDLTSFVLAAQEIERQKTALLNAVMRLAGRGFFDVSPMTQSEALEDLEMMWEAIAKATAT